MSQTDRAGNDQLAYSERDLDANGILSRKTRWRLRREGRFPEPREIGGRKLYVGEEVRRWLRDPRGWAANRSDSGPTLSDGGGL